MKKKMSLKRRKRVAVVDAAILADKATDNSITINKRSLGSVCFVLE
jgi:hypothetical protein